VAITLTIGAVILWIADRTSRHERDVTDVTFPVAFGIGAAQAFALVPGISRSGISISAGLFAGLTREAAARFSFLMATPITAGAGIWEIRKLVSGEAGVAVDTIPLIVGVVAALVSGIAAIEITLRFLRTHPVTVFVVYRVALSIVVLVAWLNLRDR
jgi:undecaprenyl-diphosphatase